MKAIGMRRERFTLIFKKISKVWSLWFQSYIAKTYWLQFFNVKNRNYRRSLLKRIAFLFNQSSCSFTCCRIRWNMCYDIYIFAFDFTILQDFGTITMINVFFALAVTILVLPSLVVIVDRWRDRRRQAKVE